MTAELNLPLLIKTFAQRHKVPHPVLVCMILQESSGNPKAERFEPKFYDKYIMRTLAKGRPLPGFMPKDLSNEDYFHELKHRATSYGLLQVMGQVAREQGFKARSLLQLKEPSINLDVGCRFYKKLEARYGEDIRGLLLRWNGGGEPKYPDKVLAWKYSESYSALYLP